MVTATPGPPLVGLTLLMLGALTVKATLLLARLLTVTTTFELPEGNPLGTAAVMLVALQALTEARVPPNVTVLDPCVEPKLAPLMVIAAPMGPVVGDKPEIVGADCAYPGRLKINNRRMKPVMPMVKECFICVLHKVLKDPWVLFS